LEADHDAIVHSSARRGLSLCSASTSTPTAIKSPGVGSSWWALRSTDACSCPVATPPAIACSSLAPCLRALWPLSYCRTGVALRRRPAHALDEVSIEDVRGVV